MTELVLGGPGRWEGFSVVWALAGWGWCCGLLGCGRAGMLGVRVVVCGVEAERECSGYEMVGWGGRGNAAVAWRGVLKSARCLCKVWVQHFLFPFRQPN